MKSLFSILFLTFLTTITAIAADHPEAHFGKYGIEHHPTLDGYQQYVGQIVMYIPESTPSYNDKNRFQERGGKFNTPYVITKISGNNKRMTIQLKERDGKKRHNLVVNNQSEYYSYGNYTYCITDRYSVPLILIDKLQDC